MKLGGRVRQAASMRTYRCEVPWTWLPYSTVFDARASMAGHGDRAKRLVDCRTGKFAGRHWTRVMGKRF